MKKAFIEGMCCEGCARDVQHVLSNIYGISDVKVNLPGSYATFEGFVSKEVIHSALAAEGYRLLSIEKMA
jgi:copper chaperone CopZ